MFTECGFDAFKVADASGAHLQAVGPSCRPSRLYNRAGAMAPFAGLLAAAVFAFFAVLLLPLLLEGNALLDLLFSFMLYAIALQEIGWDSKQRYQEKLRRPRCVSGVLFNAIVTSDDRT